MYPEDSVRYTTEDWRTEDGSFDYCRGRLIKAFLPRVDQVPKQLVATGRAEPTDHVRANFRIEPLRIEQPRKKTALPVAALPAFENEINAVYRAKKRPAIIVCEGGELVDRKPTKGKPRWRTAPTVLAAPCYGIDEGGSRAGFNPEFIARERCCTYPRFMRDKLPVPGANESVPRLNHIQPVGRRHDAIEPAKYRLTEEALLILDDWLSWLVYGDFSEDSLLLFFKRQIENIEKSF